MKNLVMSKNIKIVSIVGLIISVSFGFYVWFSYDNGIVDYVSYRDKAAIHKMFADDWDLLISDESQDSYSVDFMLDNRSTSQHSVVDKLILKVLRVQGKTIGFTAYYPKSPYWWQLLFLVIDKDYRKQGYASKLIAFDIDDMKARGAVKITIWTKLANTSARSLYEGKFEFKDIAHHDDKYMDLVRYFPLQ